MDQGVINAIDSVGFPIVCACGFAFVLWKMYCKMEKTLDRITETNAELARTNAVLIGSIKEEVQDVREDVKDIKVLIQK